MSIKFSVLIFFVSVIYGLLHGSGFYGYGVDYYHAYQRINYSYGGFVDALGWRISTFGVEDIHLGVYLVTFFLAFSLSSFMKSFLSYLNIKIGLSAFVAFLLLIHSWPIFMSTSNAMRQGVMMSFLYLSFSYFLRAESRKGLVPLTLIVFSHKSGLFFLVIAFIDYLFREIRKIGFFKNLSEVSLFVLFSVFLSLVSIPFMGVLFQEEEASRIIRTDKRYVLLFLNILYVCVYLFILDPKNKSNYMARFLFLFSLTAPSVMLAGKNWEYDRLNMIMMNAYVLFYATCFPRSLRAYYIVFISFVFFAATYYMGMFSSFK